MKRREFLVSTAGIAALASARAAWARAPMQAGSQAKQTTLDRIAIMTLNFQDLLKLPDLEDGPARTLELFDVPQMLADTYGVHKVEFQHYHITSTEPSYLKELRGHLEKAKSRMTQINLEFGELNITAPELRDRLMAIDLTKMWVNHAVMLGAQRVMINQGQPTDENKDYGIPTLKAMADYGKSKGIIVSVETRGTGGRRRNRGGTAGAGAGSAGSASAATPAGAGSSAASPTTPEPRRPGTGPKAWALLAEIIKGAGAYSNVDLGGAGAFNQEELHACLRMMSPMAAGSIHTRVNTRWDLATAIKFLEHDLAYKGLYTIESGQGHEGTKEIYDVVLATL